MSIEWVDIIDTSSWFWEAGVPGPANVPLSIRRNAIATFSNMKRAMEEVSLIKEDMANFFTSFLDEHQVVLAAVPPSGEGQYMQGARATLVGQLYAIECTLKECRKIFSAFIQLPPLPQLNANCPAVMKTLNDDDAIDHGIHSNDEVDEDWEEESDVGRPVYMVY